MTETKKVVSSKQGQLLSVGLTTEQTENVRDFYVQVIGWDYDAFATKDLSGYAMNSETGESARAIFTHLAGQHAELPPVWIPCFQVDDLQKSLDRCRNLGGKVVYEPEPCCGTYAVIEYPAGAVCALYQGK